MNDQWIACIVKSMEICTDRDDRKCYNCPYINRRNCRDALMRDALQLIEQLRNGTP